MNKLNGRVDTTPNKMTTLYSNQSQNSNTLVSLSPKKIINVAPTPCPTFEQHQGLVTESFVKSGVDNWLRSESFQFVADTAINPTGNSVFPIHEFLDWKITRFGHKARDNSSALLMFNEDGSEYQAIVSKPHKDKPYSYLAPKGAGNRAFLPHVPKAVRVAIVKRYGVRKYKGLLDTPAFWDFIAAHPDIPIVITEGVKKSLSLLSQGYVAIAVYGYRCLQSPDLDRFLPGRDVTIAMDSDTGVSKWYSINSAVLKDAKSLGSKGVSSVSIATWVGSKGIDDLLIERGAVAVDDAIGNALSPSAFLGYLKRFKKANSRELGDLALRVNNSRMAKWLRRATGFSATHEFDKPFIGLDDIQSGVDSEDWLIAIKSGLGTGKTQVLNPLIAWLESSGKGRGVAMLGYRNSLLLQTAKRISAYHLHHHSAFDLIADADSRIVACLDSLEHFPDDYFDGKILILDELTSIVKHLLCSSTCAKNRSKILDKFVQAIKRSAIVVSLDGNLADWVVDYLQTLRSGSKGVAKLLNTYNLQNTPLEILPSFGQSGLVSKIIEVLPGYRSQNKSIAIATDSQRLGEKLDLMFTEKGYRVYRIDSKTITQKEVKKYIESPDRELDILIYTPSCESGLDIPLEGFAHTFAFFLGVVDTATQIQMLRRVRKVDRITVQCVPYSRLNRQRSPILEEFQQELENALLLDGSEQLDCVKFWLERQKESLHYPILCELLQNRDFERTNTLACLVELARSHGYSPEIVDIADCKATGLELSKASQQVKEGEAIAIFKAQDLTVSQAIAIKASFTASLDDRYALQKFEIKDTLPGIENTEFWNVEGIIEIRNIWRSIPNLKLLWHSRNLEKSKLLSDKRWQGWIEQDRFLGDCLSNPYAKAKMIQALGILNLPDNFSADSPEIQAIEKAGIDKRRGMRSVLGVVKGSLEPIQWVKNLLGLVGLQAGASGRKSGQSRTYQIVDFSHLYETVLSCISKGLESQYQQALEACQLVENIVPNLPPVGMDLENTPTPPEEPKNAPPEPPKYIPEMVTFIRDGVKLIGELLGQQGEFIRVRVDGVNYLANTDNLVA